MSFLAPTVLAGGSTTGTSDSVSVTVPDNCRAIEVRFWSRCDTSFASQKVTGATVGGASCTEDTNAQAVYNSQRGCQVFYIVAPDTGVSKTVAWTRANAATQGTYEVICIRSDTHQAAIRSPSAAKAAFTQSDSFTVGVSVAADDLVIVGAYALLSDDPPTYEVSSDDGTDFPVRTDGGGGGNQMQHGYDTAQTGSWTYNYSQDQGSSKTLAGSVTVWELGAPLSLSVDNLMAIDDVPNDEVDLTWDVGGSAGKRLRVGYWPTGETHETAPMTAVEVLLAGTTSYSIAPRPDSGVYMQFGVQTLDDDDSVLALNTASIDLSILGTGGATLPALAASGSGQGEATGTGSAVLPALTVSGAGEVASEASGNAALPALTVSGAGEVDVAGTGTPSLPALRATSGIGEVAVTGSGSPDLPALEATGSSTAPAPTQGAGVADFPALRVTSANGEVSVTGTGAAPLGSLEAAGVGAVQNSGTGAAPLPALQAGGAGTYPLPTRTGEGSVTLSALITVGAGTVGNAWLPQEGTDGTWTPQSGTDGSWTPA